MSSVDAPAQDARDWSREMSAVAASQDRDGFMRIYDHFMPRLCLYLRGLGTPEAVAEELAQESMLRLWQHAAAYDPRRSAVSTWLFRIARNLCIDRARRLRYQAAQAEKEGMLPVLRPMRQERIEAAQVHHPGLLHRPGRGQGRCGARRDRAAADDGQQRGGQGEAAPSHSHPPG